MSTTVLEVLENAQINFRTFCNLNKTVALQPIFIIALEQLDNGIKALQKGHKPDHIIQEGLGGAIRL